MFKEKAGCADRKIDDLLASVEVFAIDECGLLSFCFRTAGFGCRGMWSWLSAMSAYRTSSGLATHGFGWTVGC
jgi:hypothetical protein